MAIKYWLNEPYLDQKEIDYATQVIQKGWLSAGGEFTKKFERAFAQLIGTQHAIAVQSGTAALHSAMLAMGVKLGDKVVIPNYTCGACATAVLQTGAHPVIIDVEPKTFGLDVNILEEVLSTQNIKVVMVVHVYGFPCRDLDTIAALCKKHNVFLLEDSSEAHGATYQGKTVGTFGDISTFSVRSEKMIGVGEGGLVLTNNQELRDKAHFYASRAAPHRREQDPWEHKYIYTDVGMNYLLPHLLGAIGLAQVEKFPLILQKKRFIGQKYRELFQNLPGILLQEIAPGTNPCFWLNSILIDKEEKQIRQIGVELMKQGLEIRPAFWPLSDLPVFKPYAYGTQHNAIKLLKSMIVLPSSIKLAENNGKAIEEIVEIVKSAIAKF
ncbi:TPA: DegT/DnrJ/EryC1/StrS family aminotransferase [Candidatus Woesearchaeota archaeon]|nr:DegT/DnrJ/EryC1/StrS family aminotransferase [Candidatus Woesearchaeota archaeon]HIG93418.1 DegT/DnrJ/EryC1/StrS family aminotransferase [Candidatus Woesearchaeota archaeon]HIH12359.1 DegT/DnrJ/EryC1/StrS family aminotransferase [Candidatus Woesearchaeota archaeon]